jgi:hypothetical protein
LESREEITENFPLHPKMHFPFKQFPNLIPNRNKKHPRPLAITNLSIIAEKIPEKSKVR